MPSSSKTPSTSKTRLNTSSRHSVDGGSSDNSFLVSIVEGRGTAAEIGFAAIDLRTSECLLGQFADSQTYVKTLHKLYLLNPSEVIVPVTNVEPVKSNLVLSIEDQEIDVIAVNRKHFNDQQGLSFLRQYSINDLSNLPLGITSKYFCLAAVAALIKYLEVNENVSFMNKSIQFKYRSVEDSMMIDPSTATNLELVSNITNFKGYSLFKVLNYCSTTKLLRMNILQPLFDESTINTRLDAVEELLTNEESFFAIQTTLKSFRDTDHLISSLIQTSKKASLKVAEQSINHIITLKHNIQLVEPLKEGLAGFSGLLLGTIRAVLSDDGIMEIQQRINEVINEDIVFQKTPLGFRNQRAYAIKAGFNGLLDVARQTYKETNTDVYDYVTELSEKYNLSLKTVFNPTRGFHLSLNDPPTEASLPMEFLNFTKKGKKLNFTTLRLMSFNDRIKESLTEVYLMSDRTIAELIQDVRKNLAILYKLSECVALLDLLMSYAHYCTITNCVRPEFTDTLAVKSARHPIRDVITPMTPNDMYANAGDSLLIITGPNMSGKSTFLRQVALLQVMSQIGSFIPAEYASFRLSNMLFSRIGNDDSLEANASSFMLEMREMAFVLENITNTSLVIIDELGRGTSNSDGLAVTLAICEDLIKSEAFVFIATHFKELSEIMSLYPNVVNMHMSVSRDNDSMKYTYLVKDGISTQEHYGLELALMAGLSRDVIDRSYEISVKLEEKLVALKSTTAATPFELKRRLKVKLVEKLIQIKKSSGLDRDSLIKYLGVVKAEYLESF